MSPRVGMFSIFSVVKPPPVLLHIATARVWQDPGSLQLIAMAGLPSVQVTCVAFVSDRGSSPSVLFAMPQAATRPAMPTTNIH